MLRTQYETNTSTVRGIQDFRLPPVFGVLAGLGAKRRQAQSASAMASRIAQTVEQWGRAVVQQYIERPLLVSGIKFDLRLYVAVLGWHVNRPHHCTMCAREHVRMHTLMCDVCVPACMCICMCTSA